MRRLIYYVHSQSGRTLFVDTLRHAADGCPAAAAVCSGENLRTNTDVDGYIDRQTDGRAIRLLRTELLRITAV